MRPSKLPIVLTGIGLAALYTPIAILVLYGFNDSRLVTVWTHPSTRWFSAALSDLQLMAAAKLSVELAASSASLATVLGAFAALAVRANGYFSSRILSGLFLMPVILPDVVIGFGLLVLFAGSAAFLGWPVQRGSATLLLAHVTMGTPYAMLIILAQLQQHDWSLEEAAADLGANPLEVLWRITTPLALPSLVGAWLATFVVSFDDVIVANFVSGPGASTLPMVIFSSLRLGLTPEVNAMAALVMASVLVISCIIVALAPALTHLRSVHRQYAFSNK